MKQKTVFLTILGLFIGILAAIIIYFMKPQQKNIETPITPTPTVSSLRPQPYYLSQTSSVPTVTGISWNGEKLLYSSLSGIYEPLNSSPLINTNIDYISWSQNGYALFLNNNVWYLFNPNTNRTKTIKIKGSEAHISPSGQEALIVNRTVINKINLENNKEQEKITLSQEPTSVVWENPENIVIVVNNNGKIAAEVFDASLSRIGSFELKKSDTSYTISPNGSSLAIVSNNQLRIVDTTSAKTKQSYNFQDTALIRATWINPQELIVLESYQINQKINRKTENIWRISISSSTKELLTNSNPIPGKLDFGIQPRLSGSRIVLALVENNGPIWLLSLRPGFAANYSLSGISFIPIPTPQQGNEL